jgi:hypothetical protein
MGASPILAGLRLCGLLLCLLAALPVAGVQAQTTGALPLPSIGTAPVQLGMPAGATCQDSRQAFPSLFAAWTSTPTRATIGYSGLILPGQCVASYFVYPIEGIRVGGSLPIRLTSSFELKAYGSYLFVFQTEADQEINWLNTPPGVRQWRQTRSDSYLLAAEGIWRLNDGTGLVGGVRYESLTSTFGDPNPNYQFTVPNMESQATVTAYQPYLGVRFHQSVREGDITVRFVGFPCFLAGIQHFNTCNNAGVPFAHVGSSNMSKGYFLEGSAEYSLGLFQGFQASGFVAWDMQHGECPMYLERIDGGAGNSTTGTVVNFRYDKNAVTVGAKMVFSWNLPF